jgi:hypothetical protein
VCQNQRLQHAVSSQQVLRQPGEVAEVCCVVCAVCLQQQVLLAADPASRKMSLQRQTLRHLYSCSSTMVPRIASCSGTACRQQVVIELADTQRHTDRHTHTHT